MKFTEIERALAQDWLRHKRELAQAEHDKPFIWLAGFGVGLLLGVGATLAICLWVFG